MLKKVALSIALISASFVVNAAELTGAGSSFAAPIYSKWADAYQKATGNKINYQAIGSSGGLKQVRAKTVDFGASDMPLTDAELQKDGLVQFPTVMGGVVPVMNLPGVKPGALTLNGSILADIYLGKIKKWNDPAIVALNKGLALPAQDILPVRRADGSGTSFIFTNYLSKVSDEWKTKVGEGTTVNWPVGTGGKGNEGVSAFVQRLGGAIGYVEYAYAKKNNMTYAKMINANGAVVAPDDETFKAAAAGADWSKTYYQILTNQAGKTAWPIAGATFIVMHKVQDKPVQGAESLKFFDWSYANGNKMASELDYVPMPEAVVKQIRGTWKSSIKDSAGQPVLN